MMTEAVFALTQKDGKKVANEMITSCVVSVMIGLVVGYIIGCEDGRRTG